VEHDGLYRLVGPSSHSTSTLGNAVDDQGVTVQTVPDVGEVKDDLERSSSILCVARGGGSKAAPRIERRRFSSSIEAGRGDMETPSPSGIVEWMRRGGEIFPACSIVHLEGHFLLERLYASSCSAMLHHCAFSREISDMMVARRQVAQEERPIQSQRSRFPPSAVRCPLL
jgi:hypothetical protein